MNKEAMRGFVSSNLSNEELTKALKLLFKINPKIGSILGWAMACHIKPQIASVFSGFPILALQGEPFSGKTATSWVIAKLCGTAVPVRLNLVTSTLPQLVKHLSSSKTLPVLLDEFNPNKVMTKPYLDALEALKSSYTNVAYSAGKIRASVKAPCIVISENPILDLRLKERCIEVRFEKPGNVAKKSFYKLEQLHFTKLAEIFAEEAAKITVDQVKKWVATYPLDSLQQVNLAVISVGLLFLRHVIKQLNFNCVRQFNVVSLA
jgi:hypothetical protein